MSKLSFDGYVADMPYTRAFFKEQNPFYLRTLRLLHKCDFLEKKHSEKMRYLELGYGQGQTLAMLACANEGEFWGTDFSPDHAIIAQKMVEASGAKARILNDSFAELAEKSRQGFLPQFDYITLHGIWSWINDENRDYILSIISHSLKVGGIVYVSYNALPGVASFEPVREFFNYYAQNYSVASKSNSTKFSDAYNSLKPIAGNLGLFFRYHPTVLNKFQGLDKKNPVYIVHEYMNDNWQPFYFKDVSRAMGQAKCSFTTSARPLTALTFTLPEEIQCAIQNAPDTDLKETLRDFAFNTQFRCDIFSKGNNRLDEQEYLKKLNELSFVLLIPKGTFSYKIQTPDGEVDCGREHYEPLLEFLASEDYRPKTFTEIHSLPHYQNLSMLIEVITVLLGASVMHPAQKVTEEMQAKCNALNLYFCSQKEGVSSKYLVSPVIGGGVVVQPMEQNMLLAKVQGLEKPEQYVPYLSNLYKENGKKLYLEGNELTDEDAEKELYRLSEELEEKLPILSALEIF